MVLVIVPMRISNMLMFTVIIVSFLFSHILLLPLPIRGDDSTSFSELEINSKLSPDLKKPLLETYGDIRLIIQFYDELKESDKELVEGLGFTIQRTFHVVPSLSVNGPVSAIEDLQKNKRIKYIEHNDPVIPDMEMGTWVINATEVWSSLVMDGSGRGWDEPIDGSGVTVAVVDTGIDAGHPDLDYGLKTVQNVFDAGNGVWIEGENTDTNYGHGTHVAGTVAGNGDASAGARRGVAPGANLIGVTVSIPEELTSPTEDC
jgi:serine protease AprX